MPSFRAMTEEWREEARADERAAAAGRLRARSLAEALGEAMAAGDTVTVRCGDRSWSGRVVGLGGDHALVATATDGVVVNLDGPVLVGRRAATTGGTAGDRSHKSLRARLATLELVGEAVEVVTPHGSATGTLVAARDHLVVTGETGEHLVPIDEVGVVVAAAGGGGLAAS